MNDQYKAERQDRLSDTQAKEPVVVLEAVRKAVPDLGDASARHFDRR
jgi:hypothetical protein